MKALGRAIGAIGATVALMGALAMPGAAWAEDHLPVSATAVDEGDGEWTLRYGITGGSITGGQSTSVRPVSVYVTYDDSSSLSGKTEEMRQALDALASSVFSIPGSRMCVANDSAFNTYLSQHYGAGTIEEAWPTGVVCSSYAGASWNVTANGGNNHFSGFRYILQGARTDTTGNKLVVVQVGDSGDDTGTWGSSAYSSAVAQAGLSGAFDAYVVGFLGSNSHDTGAAQVVAKELGGTYLDGSDANGLQDAFARIGTEVTKAEDVHATGLSLSLSLTDHATPSWTTFSRSDVTLGLSDGSAPPSGWTASYDASSRTVTVAMPDGWVLPDGVTLSASIRVTGGDGTKSATSYADWKYRWGDGLVIAPLDAVTISGAASPAPRAAQASVSAEARGDAATGRWTLTHSITGGSSTSSSVTSTPVSVYVAYDNSGSMAGRADDMKAAVGQLARAVLVNPKSRMCVIPNDTYSQHGGEYAGDWADITLECTSDPNHAFDITANGGDQHAAGWELALRNAARDDTGNRRVVIQVGDSSDPERTLGGTSITNGTLNDQMMLNAWNADWYGSITGQVGGSIDKYIVGFVTSTDSGAARRCAEKAGATYLDGSDKNGLQAAFSSITSQIATVTVHTTAPSLSFRLTDHATPDWTAFSRGDVTLGLSDGSALPSGWTAGWDEATRTVTVATPAGWVLSDGVTLSATVDVTSDVGEWEATSDAAWSYNDGAGRGTMDPLVVRRDTPLSATLPATGGLMAAVGFAAVMLGAAALLARMRARTALNG